MVLYAFFVWTNRSFLHFRPAVFPNHSSNLLVTVKYRKLRANIILWFLYRFGLAAGDVYGILHFA
jgi:hypothetical protein